MIWKTQESKRKEGIQLQNPRQMKKRKESNSELVPKQSTLFLLFSMGG